MEDVKLKLDKNGSGEFYLANPGGEKIGEMVMTISENNLTVYHTEVMPGFEGRGLAKKLLETMVAYSRTNNLKVIPLCPFVYKWFSDHAEAYEDIWKNIKK
jgi:predicted GNAT family acetyltransferase